MVTEGTKRFHKEYLSTSRMVWRHVPGLALTWVCEKTVKDRVDGGPRVGVGRGVEGIDIVDLFVQGILTLIRRVDSRRLIHFGRQFFLGV